MQDLRQTESYSQYMKLLGWEVGKVDSAYYFLKKIPIIGSVIKIQRPKQFVLKSSIDKIAKKERAFLVLIEPRKNIHSDYYKNEWKFRIIKSPSLPSKTIQIDLRKTSGKLLSEMHQKARYNIGLAQRRAVEVSKSNDIEKFADFWQKCAKKRGMYLSQTREIKAIYKAFKKDSHILSAYLKKELLATVLLLSTLDSTYYMYAASITKGNKLFAPSLLVWESIRFAKKQKRKKFDFAGIYDERFPQKSWKGFSQFKKRFGGVEVEYPGSLVKYYLPF